MNLSLLVRFLTVTLVPVIYRNEVRYELRLYIPNRLTPDQVTEYLTWAVNVYGSMDCTLEYNRAGMCYNAFVEVTKELRDAVNHARESKGRKPQCHNSN